MRLYDRILGLCSERNVSIRRLEQACGMSHGVIRRWNDRQPSADRVKRVADYFGVTVPYLLGDTKDRDSEIMLDPEIARVAQCMKDRPELKVLFDASRVLRKDEVELITRVIKKIK